MLVLTKSALALMVSFLLATVVALALIPLLKKIKAGQRLSIYLEDAHRGKEGTPTMGGLIFIIASLVTCILLWMTGKIQMSTNFLIILLTFVGYCLIGFIDDYLIIKRHNNAGLSEGSKMGMQIVLAILFFYLFMRGGNEPLLWIHSIGFKWNIGWFYGIFILFILVASSNAVNLTDGLDGLAGGLSAIALLAFGIIAYAADWLEGYQEISLFCFILVGAILGFLIFNVSPAKVFMGDTGSLALGGVLGAIAILTRHELLLVLLMIVFVIETVSVILQRYYYKLTKKRLFPMAPLHHSFEKQGWQERDIVKLFWVVGLIGALLAIIYGAYL
ncbi:MAG: phospho-N-acetylmuramoyl-pentapeptide-transferase [Bacilli bacterium]|nr:phospho-N-acetylmuramoyl-pentapeptide-transferase [Bacilli bacterium]